MKYLKSFNENESSDSKYNDIISDIKDILLELTDVGFKRYIDKFVKLIESEWWDGFDVLLTRNHTDRFLPSGHVRDKFQYNEISEDIERLKDYMDQSGFRLLETQIDGNKNNNIISEDDKMYRIRLQFLKKNLDK